jgi:hypothetical protein
MSGYLVISGRSMMLADARAAAMRAASICVQPLSGVLIGSMLDIKSSTEPSLSLVMLNPRYNVTIVEALTFNETLLKCFQFFIFHIDFHNDIGPA